MNTKRCFDGRVAPHVWVASLALAIASVPACGSSDDAGEGGAAGQAGAAQTGGSAGIGGGLAGAAGDAGPAGSAGADAAAGGAGADAAIDASGGSAGGDAAADVADEPDVSDTDASGDDAADAQDAPPDTAPPQDAAPVPYCDDHFCQPAIPTGQTGCWNATSTMTCPSNGNCAKTDFCGQDAQYPGATRTLQPTLHGGVWVVVDSLTGLMWQQGASATTSKLTAAVTYCDQLDYAGETDWRLPTIAELQGLVDYSGASPAIDSSAFPNTPANLWSSTITASEPTLAWTVSFGDGRLAVVSINSLWPSRCVRGPAAPPEGPARFQSTGGGGLVILDQQTDLRWQMSEAPAMTWQEALAYCEGLAYGGRDDWRLPNINEVATLVSFAKKWPASAFPGMSENRFWTSTTAATTTGAMAWYVHMQNGLPFYQGKLDALSVRCVTGL
ncbi:MAG TPA: DUF1566 domain-containing protein [Polyangiaceae bacterium]|nr:DUF1566 domain-containing protein [Polyangiaceae bacterium]